MKKFKKNIIKLSSLFLTSSGMMMFAGCFDINYSDSEIIDKINTILEQYDNTKPFQAMVLYNSMQGRKIWSIYDGFNDDDRLPKDDTPYIAAYDPDYLANGQAKTQTWSIFDAEGVGRNYNFDVIKLGDKVAPNVYNALIELDQPNPTSESPAVSQDNQLLFWLQFNIKNMSYDQNSYNANTVLNQWFRQSDNPINKLTSKNFTGIYQNIQAQVTSQKLPQPPLPDENSIQRVDVPESEYQYNGYSGFIKSVDPSIAWTVDSNDQVHMKFLSISLWYQQIITYKIWDTKSMDYYYVYVPLFIAIHFNINNGLITNQYFETASDPGDSIDVTTPHRDWVLANESYNNNN
ncbi:hypothetical protein [Mycoplasma sp. SG1]|uniref:hypothetical protein n=1 Tax=Mycoplasma sp. SG1 TaxID=2810348 RepID=UPI002025AC9A|nr:hypothetical protein [Mycoplasma sp. SG1]URM52944.1 hypothetical protein JRW51_01185 [Mycoplasma sp. SG1]